jgi:hemerythrin
MELIHWNEVYSIGCEEIDNQHRKLVDMVAALQKSLSQGLVNPQVGTALKELVAYTQYHFEAEERIMRESEYPGIAEHKQRHTKLVSQIVKILKDLKRGESITAIQLIQILKAWLVDHIMLEDKKIGEHLKMHSKSAGAAGLNSH